MNEPKASVKAPKKIPLTRLIRSVASSSAIETREAIEVIELKLKNRKSVFNCVRLQLAL